MFFAANGTLWFRRDHAFEHGYHIATWLAFVAIGLGMITALNDYPNMFLGEIAVPRMFWLAETDPRR